MKNQITQTRPTYTQQGFINKFTEKIYLQTLLRNLKPLTSTPLLLSFNSTMVVIFGCYLYKIAIAPSLLLAAFLITFSVYSLNKVTDKAEDSINNKNLPNASKYYLGLSIIAMITGLIIGIFSGIMATVILFSPVIIGLIYSVKISNALPRLKEIIGVKSIIVALSWALTGCLLPIAAGIEKLNISVIVFGYIFVRIFVGTILCDVLDKKGDAALGIRTIPIKLGKNNTRKLLFTLNSIGLALSIFCITTQTYSYFVPALLFGVIYGYVTIAYVFKNNCRNSIAGLMLDSEWLPIVIIASIIS